MRDREHMKHQGSARARWGAAVAAAALVVSSAAPARAELQGTAPASQPPPGYGAQPPPPGYGAQPPPGYGAQPPPPGYGQAPAPAYYGSPGSYVTVMGPPVLSWQEGQPLQPGYHLETRIRKNLVVGGAVTFGSMYLVTALVGAVATDMDPSAGFAPLFAPIVGPFITIGTAHASSTGAFVLILDGLAQAGGVAMLVAGLAAPMTVQVRDAVASRPFVRPTPMTFGANSGGIGLVGSF